MMNERRRIDRAAGNAVPKEPPSAPAPVREAKSAGAREPRDAFLSEAELAPRGIVVSNPRLRRNRRRPLLRATILSDADAFLSEVSACASDRPIEHAVSEAFPAETDSLPADAASLIAEDLIPATAVASDLPLLALPPAVPPLPDSGRRVLSSTMRLAALSASFFIAVVLLTSVLDWGHRVLFTTDGQMAVFKPSVQAPALVDAAALPVRPAVKSTPADSQTPPQMSDAAPIESPVGPALPALALVVDPLPSLLARVEPPAVVAPQFADARMAPVERVALLEPAPAVPAAATPAVTSPIVAPSAVTPSAVVPAAAAPRPADIARAEAATEDAAALADVESDAADEIDGVLTQYRGAFNTLDSAAARGVWPTVDERALDRAFARLQQQEVAFDRCDIDVAGVRAAARCTGSARFVPKVGSRTAQTSSREWRFNLQKVDDRWVIEAVDAR